MDFEALSRLRPRWPCSSSRQGRAKVGARVDWPRAARHRQQQPAALLRCHHHMWWAIGAVASQSHGSGRSHCVLRWASLRGGVGEAAAICGRYGRAFGSRRAWRLADETTLSSARSTPQCGVRPLARIRARRRHSASPSACWPRGHLSRVLGPVAERRIAPNWGRWLLLLFPSAW